MPEKYEYRVWILFFAYSVKNAHAEIRMVSKRQYKTNQLE